MALSPEVQLWRAVVTQIIRDAMIDPENIAIGNTSYGTLMAAKREAHACLGKRAWIGELCELAGLDGDRLHKLYCRGQLFKMAEEAGLRQARL